MAARKVSFVAAFKALVLAMFISYVLCIIGDVVFGWTMYQVWAPLLPGFTWPLTMSGFFLGLLWLVVYSLYAGIVLVLPYNYLIREQTQTAS